VVYFSHPTLPNKKLTFGALLFAALQNQDYAITPFWGDKKAPVFVNRSQNFSSSNFPFDPGVDLHHSWTPPFQRPLAPAPQYADPGWAGVAWHWAARLLPFFPIPAVSRFPTYRCPSYGLSKGIPTLLHKPDPEAFPVCPNPMPCLRISQG